MNNDYITEANEETRKDAAVFGMSEQFHGYADLVQMAASQDALKTLEELGEDNNDYNFYLYACRHAEALAELPEYQD